MSFGAISAPAVRALSRGAAVAGCWMDTGEGGLSSYHLEGGCDIIMQIGTAKYGVRECWLLHQTDVSMTVIRFDKGRVASREVYGRGQRIVSDVLPEFAASLDDIFR